MHDIYFYTQRYLFHSTLTQPHTRPLPNTYLYSVCVCGLLHMFFHSTNSKTTVYGLSVCIMSAQKQIPLA